MSSDDEMLDLTPPEVCNLANETTKELLPEKSKQKYDLAYDNFMAWKERSNAKSFSEVVLLAYIGELGNKYKPNTVWSIYSMLRTSLIAKHNINIGNYMKLKAVLKRRSEGYKPKKSDILNPQQMKQFMETAPDEKYLLIKVALAFAISGALRRAELANVKTNDLNDATTALIVKVPNTKNKVPRTFTLTGTFYEIYKKYADLRPKTMVDKNNRFFVNYQKGKCTSQFVGINKFGGMAKEIATFLKLPNPENYTGHSFRRSSATILVDSGGDLLSLKRHGGWKSSTVAEGYINESINKKMEISNQITQSIEYATTFSTELLGTSSESQSVPTAKPSTSTTILETNNNMTGINNQAIQSLIKENNSIPLVLNNCSNITINNYFSNIS